MKRIFFLALFVRCAYILCAPSRSMELDDSKAWNTVAMRFYRGTGVTEHTYELDPIRPPIYPFFMALTYSVFGEQSFTAVKLAQAVIGSLTCVIFGYWASSWLLALILALYPPLIIYCAILQSETLYTFLLSIFLLSGGGIALGVLNLCRANLILYPFCLMPLGRKWVKVALVSFAIVAPWTYRNYRVYGTFMPVSAGGPQMFWMGTLPWNEQRLWGNSEAFKAHTGSYIESAITNVRNDITGYIKLCGKKFIFFWFQPVGQELLERSRPLLGKLLYIPHALMILLAWFGIYRSWNWKKYAPVYLLIFYFGLIHTILAPQPRYRLPIEPLLLMFVTKIDK